MAEPKSKSKPVAIEPPSKEKIEEYIHSLLKSGYEEIYNRATEFANVRHELDVGFKGNDYIIHNPTIFIRYFWNEEKKLLKGTVHFSLASEGGPKAAHGASVATAFDEVLSVLVWQCFHKQAYTISLTVRFERSVNVGETFFYSSSIDSYDENKRLVTAKCELSDGKTITNTSVGAWKFSDRNITSKL